MRLSDLIATDERYDVELDLEDGDIVTDIVALIRVQRLTDTDDALITAATETTGGIVQYGILRSAVLQAERWMAWGDGDE